jgi:hypothetical protein
MSQVTEKMLDNELFTFCNRTENQLAIRVRMLFDPVKLQTCRIMSDWCGLKKIEMLTRKKLEMVLNDVLCK